MKPITKKINRRVRRKKHVRKRVIGTPERPRLTVFRSNKNIYAQIIDDTQGRSLVSVSSLSPDLRGQLPYWGNAQAASIVGKAVAEKAKSQGITKVCLLYTSDAADE